MDGTGNVEAAEAQTGTMLARRFLNACAGIEEALTARHKLTVKGLGSIIREAEPRNAVVRRNIVALRAFKDLRDVLSHKAYRNGEPIAAPLQVTVNAIEQLLEELQSPRLALDFAAPDVLTASFDDPLHELLVKMIEGDISQVPVISHAKVELLTTNAIARWVAAHIDWDGSVLIEAGVTENVLMHAEAHESIKLMKRTATASKALGLLTRDTPPAAVLITESGTVGERPLGILTRADVPRLVDALTVTPM